MKTPGRVIATLLAVAGMYSLLGTARGLSEALREAGRLAAAVDGMAIGLWFVVVRLAASEDADESASGLNPKTIAAAALFGLATLGLAGSWSLPEERFHLPQYFAIALLLWWTTSGRWVPALLAVVAIGLGDELHQGSLASRVFDPRDILANACCGGAAVMFLAGGRARWLASALIAVCWGVLTLFPPHIAPGPLDASVLAPAQAKPTAESRSKQPPPKLGPAPAATLPVGSAPYAGAPVVLVTIDALRADHVEPWGRAPVPTPNLDRLHRESAAFSEALSEAAWTSPGVVSLLTGLHPAVHGVETRGRELQPSINTPLEQLRAAGYRTVGFAGDDSETYRNLGFEATLQRHLPSAEALEGGLDAVVAASPDAPFFAWLHMRQIHAPYNATRERLDELGLPVNLPQAPVLDRARMSHTVPRAMFPGRHHWLKPAIATLYAAEVADADDALGAVWSLLEDRGLLERAVLVVTADHGEELLENHGIGHASTTLDTAPHPEVTRVPMFVRLPDGRGAGKVVNERFVKSDLVPTLLPLLGLEAIPLAPGVPYSGTDHSEALLAGPDLDATHTRDPNHVTPERAVLLSTSPCGWQCPPERREERVHAWVSGADRSFCRALLDAGDSCDEPIRSALGEAARRRAVLQTPVPSPEPQ